MENFAFQGVVLSDERKQRMVHEFSKMFYEISKHAFAVGGFAPGIKSTWRYSVAAKTSSSITLEFSGLREVPPPLTLYRESENYLFIRSGRNLEFLKRS